jgi:predicted transcriptional regulator
MSKIKKEEKLLTEVELEIMQKVWEGANTVRAVVDSLPKSRGLAYTTVATMMKILEQKNFIKSSKMDHTLSYQVLVPRTEYESKSLKVMTEKVFQGSSSQLVMRLLNDGELSTEELNSIKKTLEERMRS